MGDGLLYHICMQRGGTGIVLCVIVAKGDICLLGLMNLYRCIRVCIVALLNILYVIGFSANVFQLHLGELFLSLFFFLKK